MKIYPMVSGQCDCGYWLKVRGEGIIPTVGQWIECRNTECPKFGKKYKLPEIELEEIP